MRITGTMRENLGTLLVNQMFEAREEALKHEEVVVGDAVYKEVTRRFATALAALPDGWLTTGSSFGVGLRRDRYGDRHQKYTVQLTQQRGVPRQVISTRQVGKVGLKLLLGLTQKRNALTRERSERSAEVASILLECVTTEELVERWPEVTPLVAGFTRRSFVTPERTGRKPLRPSVLPSGGAARPLIDLRRLNKLLGLKT